MAIQDGSAAPIARLTFGAPEETGGTEDLQEFGANLIDISRINNAIRLIDPQSKSYNPPSLYTKWFYFNRRHPHIDLSERLYVIRARKESPSWLEIGTFAVGTSTLAVYLLQAIIMLVGRNDQVKWHREERQMKIHEYLRKRISDVDENDAQHVSKLIYHSLEGLEQSDNPLVAVDNLLTSPQQREEVERVYHELTSQKDAKH